MRNRLDRSLEPGSQLELLKKSTSSPNGRLAPPRSDMPLALFGPERYEPRYEYPLIVWLHGCKSNERELEAVMPVLSLQNYVACAPRGTQANEACGQTFQWSQSRAASTLAEEIVFASIDSAMNSFSIARQRVFLAGFGSGGTTALRIALRYPHQFAGVVSICGAFPKNHHPLSNLQTARALPILWMYGEDSTQCGVDHICETLPLMHAAHLRAMFRQYPTRDDLLTNMLSDMNHWLMEQVTKQPAALDNSVEETFSRN
ncbi:MAG: dienelactone hydrolase family protein [Pirellulaceae bacterium]|nr:dienelactone hydrolase family protein [Pirellulaceae bacterium]